MSAETIHQRTISIDQYSSVQQVNGASLQQGRNINICTSYVHLHVWKLSPQLDFVLCTHQSHIYGSVTVTKVEKNSMSVMNFSGCVEHVNIFSCMLTTACCYSSRVRVRTRATITFSVWLVSGLCTRICTILHCRWHTANLHTVIVTSPRQLPVQLCQMPQRKRAVNSSHGWSLANIARVTATTDVLHADPWPAKKPNLSLNPTL